MPYYPTLAEDVARAKEILAKGKPAHDEVAYLPEPMRAEALSGGTIYGADLYAAYKLLESFVEVITLLDVGVCELALRARDHGRELAAQDDAPPPSITCPRCGRTSYNRHDIEQRYCGACHRFHDELTPDECVCRTRGCGHAARLHVGGICQACACEGWS